MASKRIIIFIAIFLTCIIDGGLAGRFKQRRRRPVPVESQAAAAAAAEEGGEGGEDGEPDTFDAPSFSTSNKKRPRPPKFSSPQDCARECDENEPPKTCLYTFNIEYYGTLTSACETCTSNATTRLVDDCQCIRADGYEQSGLMVVNRMYPGPSIVVCEGDHVVIDVSNHSPGTGITIHWHGLTQINTQYYDGVPSITQCPISEGTTFRYQFTAENAGTHFWHAHTGLQKAAGLDGAFIVREPKRLEPNNHLWDREELDHVIFITDWLHDAPEDHYPGTLVRRPGQLPDNFLVNGRGRFTDPDTGTTTSSPLSVFKVKRGLRYRMRMINACAFVCPVTLTIQNHNLTVFSIDGEPVDPVTVTSITSLSAERYDFTINADQPIREYWIQVRGIGVCESGEMQQLATLRYESNGRPVTRSPEPSYAVGINRGVVLNELNIRCDGRQNSTNVVCVSKLKSVEPVPPNILKKVADRQYFMGFGFYSYNKTDLFKPGTYNRFLVGGGREVSSTVSNITNVFPPSPLISQRNDIPAGQICRPGNLPSRCDGSKPCACTHVYDIPDKETVIELILVDESRIPGLSHPFHLHGSAFHIISEGCGVDYNQTNINVDFLKDLDRRGKLRRNLNRPPAKDTFALPNNGFTVIRFGATNPGYWLFHCHFLPHLVDGMSAIFHFGTPDDLPPIPEGFPKCGNFAAKLEF